MTFNKIISISAVNIIKSELIKFDLKKYFRKSDFEIWDLGDYFYKKKIKYLNTNEKININYLTKFKSFNKIKKELSKLDENDLLIDPFKISRSNNISKIIHKRNIKILFFQLGPIPINNKNINLFSYFKRFINSPISYLKKISFFNFYRINPDYLMIVNKSYVKNLDFKISPNTKIILAHSFDYNRYLEGRNTIKNKLSNKQNYAVFLDEGVTGHPDYEYLNLNPFCKKDIYFEEINNFFTKLEDSLNLKIFIAGHPKVRYSHENNIFNKKIINNKTLELVKNSKLVLSHMSTSINFAVIYKKPIIFLDSDNYNLEFRNQIKLHSHHLKSKLINLSLIFNKTYFNNCFKINNIAYSKYMKSFITLNVNDKRTSWQILYDNITTQKNN
jgi:hypothetical protein